MYFLVVFFFVIPLLIYLSTVNIEIINFKADNINKIEKPIKNFEIKLSLLFLNRIKWLKFKISKEKIKKMNGTKRLINKKFNTKIKKVFDRFWKSKFKSGKRLVQDYRKIKINIDNIDFSLKFGTKNVIITSVLFSALSIFIPTILSMNIEKYKKEKHKYIITPIYKNEYFYDLSINCIISIKIAHIIKIILEKKRSDKINARRTSNRIFNGNCHEQYTRVS